MSETSQTAPAPAGAQADGWRGVVSDWGSDQRAFKNVPWGKAMMWIFLLSDTFIFGIFLLSYMAVRIATTAAWPDPGEIFALHVAGRDLPLLLIAIMTFVLISSSGTMVLAVNYGYQRDRKRTAFYLVLTALGGLTFVGMQAYEWTDLIFRQDIRPWENPYGAAQFGSAFFMITGFHGFHVSIGVLFLLIYSYRVLRGHFDKEKPGFFTSRKASYEEIETLGLYWHFVDLVWVFIFAFFYLW